MLPKNHVYIGIIFSILVYLIFPAVGILGALIIFAASVLIDVDHYSVYVWRKKDWSLKNSFKWYMEFKKNKDRTIKKLKSPMNVLHTIEFLFLFFVISIFNNLLFLIFVGFIFHSICDVYHMYREKELWAREYFLVRYLKNYKSGQYL